jgi:hypothetical protein
MCLVNVFILNDTFSCSDYTQNIRKISERMWKEVVAKCEELSRNLPGGTEKITKSSG